MRGALPKLRTATAAAASVRVYANGLESVPSPVLQQACQKGKDPPQVSPLELMYRLTFQGFYGRMHELQVGSTGLKKNRTRVLVWSLKGKKNCMIAHICVRVHLLFKQGFPNITVVGKMNRALLS